MNTESRHFRIVSSFPVSGVWAVGVNSDGGQYKDLVVLLLTAQITYDDPAGNRQGTTVFRYVTAKEMTSKGYVDDFNGLPFNTDYYIGLIYDEPDQLVLTHDHYLSIPSWKK